MIFVRRLASRRSARIGQMATPALINTMALVSLVLLCLRADELTQKPHRTPLVSAVDVVAPIFVAAGFRILLAQDPAMPNRR